VNCLDNSYTLVSITDAPGKLCLVILIGGLRAQVLMFYALLLKFKAVQSIIQTVQTVQLVILALLIKCQRTLLPIIYAFHR